MYGGRPLPQAGPLVDYGFRLPFGAGTNRPLSFEEFYSKLNQIIFVFGKPPVSFEREHSTQIVEQVIRPTGLLDPMVEVRPGGGPD